MPAPHPNSGTGDEVPSCDGHQHTCSPTKHRGCTDVLCLFVFALFVTGWVSVCSYALYNGDLGTILNPTDHKGQKCGKDPHVADKPYLMLFDITTCLYPGAVAVGCPTPQVCVEHCPSMTISSEGDFTPEEELKVKRQLQCKSNVDMHRPLQELIEGERCPAFQLKSIPLDHHCIPSMPMMHSDSTVKDNYNHTIRSGGIAVTYAALSNATRRLAEYLSSSKNLEDIMEDLNASWMCILVCLVVSMVVSFSYLCLLYIIGKVVVWTSILLSFIALGIGFFLTCRAYLSHDESPDIPDTPRLADIFSEVLDAAPGVNKYVWLVLMLIAGVAFLGLLVAFIFFRKKIPVALVVISEASRAVSGNPFTLLFPMLSWILEMLIMCCGLATAVLIASSGRPIYIARGFNVTGCESCQGFTVREGEECDPSEFEEECPKLETCSRDCVFSTYSGIPVIMQVYNLVAVVWCSTFVADFTTLALAITFCSWYWSAPRTSSVLGISVISAALTVVRYHFGTVALGSFLLASLGLAARILSLADQQVRQRRGRIGRLLLCWCMAMVWGYEALLRYVTPRAYVGVALHGLSFLNSGAHEFNLFKRNLAQIAVLNNAVAFLLLFGKIIIVSIMIAVSYVMVTNYVLIESEELRWWLAPILVAGVGSYFIANMFVGVYAVAANSTFHSFLEDREHNDGSAGRPYFMDKKTMELLLNK